MISFEPDLVLLDGNLPELEGAAGIRRLHELGAAGVAAIPFSVSALPEPLRQIWNSLAAQGASSPISGAGAEQAPPESE